VLLVGRRQRKSMSIEQRDYRTKRMFLLFEKGVLFYTEYNLRLFFFLLFRNCALLVSNDLDTLLPNYLVKKIRRKTIVYDTHEYFTGVPELEGRPFVRNTWLRIEKWIFPKIENVITVNDSIAELYKNEYGKQLAVVRNIPALKKNSISLSKKDLGIDDSKAMIILQGSGINIHRGAEEAVLAMQFVDDAVLYIIGGGDVIDILKAMVAEKKLESKVKFIPKLPMDKLLQYTMHADIGLTLDKDTNINYRFSLPNKLFDYIHAGVPVLASNLVEIEKIIREFNVGDIIDSHDPEHIAQKLNNLLNDKTRLNILKENCKFAATKLNWETEEIRLINVFKEYI
jgi:glycosyltransferase involved in cell wall biosynthesis